MTQQIKDYLEKYKITSKEQLEKHIEELSRNTTVDKDLVFMLVMFLDDENLFSREKEDNQEMLLKRGKEITYDLYKSGNRNIGGLMAETLKILIGEELKITEKEIKKVPYSTVESNSEEALRQIYGELANVTKNKKGNYQVNIVHTKENMNRLVEEELERQEQQVFKDWNSNSTDGALATNVFGWDILKDPLTFHLDSPSKENLNKMSDSFLERVKNDSDKCGILGKKENNGKTDYSEIDFDILDLMANRFNANKHKYPKGNMLKPIEEKELLFALLRHLKKMIQPVDSDPETFEEHLASILCNAQMVYQQRKLNKNLVVSK
jgi:hypothetical protein